MPAADRPDTASAAPTQQPLRRRVKRALLEAPIPLRGPLLRAGWRAWERALALRGRRDRAELARLEAGPWPVPPPRARVLVAGTGDAGFFLESGRKQAEYIQAMLARNGIPPDELTSVLDFGCGCGRLARWWGGVEGRALHGCDYNPELVAWCAENLPFMEARRSGLEPPLPYAAASFDLVYALSVFTHLPEALQHGWMRELTRVLRPGGALLFTVSGEALLDRLSPAERARFRRGELVTQFEEGAGSNLCAAFHPRRYVEETLLRGFDPLETVEPDPELADSLGLSQDLYLVRSSAGGEP